MLNLDVTTIGDNFGHYDNVTDITTIFLRNIYFDLVEDNNTLLENIVINRIVETLVHEDIHKYIDECLENPDDVDDHNVFRMLYV